LIRDVAAIPGFEHRVAATDSGEVRYDCAGEGPAVLLLHGFPQTRYAWHRVAPELARRGSVFLPDLPGYGTSEPPPDGDYSKRAMARAMRQLMAAEGHTRFAVAGHDRGGRVAYRLALDHPESVARLAVLDIVPTLDMLELTDRRLAFGTYHWFFLAQPAPLPETLIAGAPGFFVKHTVTSWAGRPDALGDEAMAVYQQAFTRSSVIHAACEDYRAGLGADADHDRADREAGRRLACPLLVLYGAEGSDGRPIDWIGIWRRWCNDVAGREIDCGHFLMEEAPEETVEALLAFLFEGQEPGEPRE
jgi:haloacetate dehalogenase